MIKSVLSQIAAEIDFAHHGLKIRKEDAYNSGWQCGDIGLERRMEVSFEYSDIDGFGKTSNKPIRLAQPGSALEMEVDRVILAAVEKESENPADIKSFSTFSGRVSSLAATAE